jgi:hypothetical protein
LKFNWWNKLEKDFGNHTNLEFKTKPAVALEKGMLEIKEKGK